MFPAHQPQVRPLGPVRERMAASCSASPCFPGKAGGRGPPWGAATWRCNAGENRQHSATRC
eukprot:8507536-Pyramimonas_sp.AAC.1